MLKNTLEKKETKGTFRKKKQEEPVEKKFSSCNGLRKCLGRFCEGTRIRWALVDFNWKLRIIHIFPGVAFAGVLCNKSRRMVLEISPTTFAGYTSYYQNFKIKTKVNKEYLRMQSGSA